jgi:LPS O-antigen subunit length determinant protein (WzzB/FepE family)
MAKKRKRTGNLTAEDHARHAEIQRMVRERIAYHEQKAREEDERRAAEGRS